MNSPPGRKKAYMRKAMKSWPFRISALVLSGIVLYAMAYTLLPRTADGVSVTVVQCATVQPVQTDFDCQGTTIFRRTFTDEATVSALRAALDGLHEVPPLFNSVECNAGDACAPTRVYTFDLLWHGIVVKGYRASVHGEARALWDATTLGVELPATEGSTTWQDLVRLTGIPVVPTAVP
jgi:hypothetical protein